MKDNLLDVLVYLYENDLHAGLQTIEESAQSATVKTGLLDAGFAANDINKAFQWLETIEHASAEPSASISRAVRVYSPEEVDLLDADCRGFLFALEHMHVLDAKRRELVLDRLFALDLDEIDIDHLKWVVLMVLSHQPDQEAARAWVENHLFADQAATLN